MKVYLRSSWFIIAQTFRASPVRTVVTTLLSLVMAAIPAAQVLAIAAMVESLGHAKGLADVMEPLLLVVAIAGLTGPVRQACAIVRQQAMTRAMAQMQTRLMRTIASMHPSELSRPGTAATIEKHSRAISETIGYQFAQLVVGILEQTMSVVGVVITIFVFSKLAGLLIVLALVPPLVFAKVLSAPQILLWERLGKIYGRERYLRDLLIREKTATELAGLGTGHRVAGMVAGRWHEVVVEQDRMAHKIMAADWFVGILSTALLVGALCAVVVGQNYGTTSVAGVYGVMAAMGAVGAAGNGIGVSIQNAPQCEDLRAFFGGKRGAPREEPDVVASVGQLSAHGLRHRYPGADVDALKGVGVTASRGEIIALVGVNGAGKTTTINAILGLNEISGGTVTIDGHDQSGMSEDAWLAHFGLLTQEFGRYEMTVREAIALGTPRTDVTDEEIWAALESAQAAGLVRKFPNGLDTQLGEQWDGLGVSGGQWQRLALARIYLRNPAIWVLDEPTSAIDAEAEQEIFLELARTRDERITVVVSHRAWTLKGMDRIYVIDEGELVQEGSYEELLHAEGRFREIFSEQLSDGGGTMPKEDHAGV